MAEKDGLGGTPLTERMRSRTKQAHSISDALINSKLLIAFTDPKLYGKALLLFWPVFREIEHKLSQHQAHPSIRPLANVLMAMRRTEQLEIDLDYFLGKSWKDAYEDPPAVAAYVRHLSELEDESPALLLVYAYHMHMAVSAGGSIIRKMARRAMSLPANTGTKVFEFKLDEGVFLNQLKNDYKAGINALADSQNPEYQERVLEESAMLFKLNNQVVKDFSVPPIAYIRAAPALCPKLAKTVLAVLVLFMAAMAAVWMGRLGVRP